MIVKVQRPLETNMLMGLSRVLIYNQDRSIHQMINVPQSIQKQIFGKQKKIYCEAHLEGTDIVLDHPVEDQPW